MTQIVSSGRVSSSTCSSAPNKAASITRSRAPEFSRMWRSCRPREAVLIGTRMAPSQAAPRKTSMNSGRFSQISATRSPGATPAACSRPAERAASSGASAKLQLCSPACTSGLAPYFAAWACSMTARLRSPGAKKRLASSGSRIVMAASIAQLFTCRSRLRWSSVRFCSSSDCASAVSSPRMDTTHSSCRRAMRRKLSRPLRVSRTMTLRRSAGS